MHYARDPLGEQFDGETRISKAKVTAPSPIKKAVPAKSNALKMRISKLMPGRRSTVDNRNDPTSAHSKVMRATAAKGSPSKEAVKSYYY